jgi:hypothetical protein
MFTPSIARADEAPARDVLVVEVAPDATELDAQKLRDAIGAELGADAVAPDDARAKAATGAIAVTVDHDARQLVVTYRGGAAPIVRRIDLPSDRAAVEREAVLLAGNLARDEAGDLVTELRKARPAAPPPAPVDSSSQDDAETRELDRLGRTLKARAREARGSQLMANALIGGGVISAAAGVTLAAATRDFSNGALFWTGTEALVLAGLVAMPGGFDKLADYYDSVRASGLPPAAVRDDVEHVWLVAARSEHSRRKLIGGVGILAGALPAVGGVAGLVLAIENKVPSGDVVPLAALGVMGWACLGVGIGYLATDGPLESALHAYEASSGRKVRRFSEVDLFPAVNLARGGAMVGLGARF